MANESDVRAAVHAIAAADVGAGGLVVLTGKAHPIVRWGDVGMNDRPISTWFVPASRIRRGTKDGLVLNLQIDVWTEPGNTVGLEEDIADRWETVLTQPNFIAEGVDAAPYLRGRREIPELDEGRRRLALFFDLWFNR